MAIVNFRIEPSAPMTWTEVADGAVHTQVLIRRGSEAPMRIFAGTAIPPAGETNVALLNAQRVEIFLRIAANEKVWALAPQRSGSVQGVKDSGTAGLARGTTAQRPALTAADRRTYFDTTLGKPMHWNGENWSDVNGKSDGQLGLGTPPTVTRSAVTEVADWTEVAIGALPAKVLVKQASQDIIRLAVATTPPALEESTYQTLNAARTELVLNLNASEKLWMLAFRKGAAVTVSRQAGSATDMARGTTAQRPILGPVDRRTYFDTTLGKTLFWRGDFWLDAEGRTVPNAPSLDLIALSLQVEIGTVGIPYSALVGNRTPGSTVAWSGLPAGIVFNDATNRLEGLPTEKVLAVPIAVETPAGGGTSKTTKFNLWISDIPYTSFYTGGTLYAGIDPANPDGPGLPFFNHSAFKQLSVGKASAYPQVYRFGITPDGASWTGDYDTAIGAWRDKQRSEFAWTGSFNFREPIWFAFKLRISDPTNQIGKAFYFLTTQIHTSPDAADSAASPPIELNPLPGNKMRVTYRGTPDAIHTSPPASSFSAIFDFPFDTWNDLVGKVVLDPFGTGSIELWRNGVKVVNLTALVLGYNDARGPYFKPGVYTGPKISGPVSAEYANIEFGSVDLSSRITTPRTLDNLFPFVPTEQTLLFAANDLSNIATVAGGTVALSPGKGEAGGNAVTLTGNGLGSISYFDIDLGMQNPSTWGVCEWFAHMENARIGGGTVLIQVMQGTAIKQLASIDYGSPIEPNIPRHESVHVSESGDMFSTLAPTKLRVRHNGRNSFGAKFHFDSFRINAAAKPFFMQTGDDAGVHFYTFILPKYDKVPGAYFMLNLPVDLVGTPGKLTWPMVYEIHKKGHHIGLDSGRADLPFTALPDIATIKAEITYMKNTLHQKLAEQAAFNGDTYIPDDGWIHVGYSFGGTAGDTNAGLVPSVFHSESVNANGATVELTSSNVKVDLASVFTPLNSATSIKLIQGMKVYGAGIETTISVLTDQQHFTTAAPIPAGVTRLSFVDESGEKYWPKIQVALAEMGIATAWGTLRKANDNHIPYRNGIVGRYLLPQQGLSNTPYLTAKGYVDRTAKRGAALRFYIHDILAVGGSEPNSIHMNESVAGPFTDYLLAGHVNGYWTLGTPKKLHEIQGVLPDESASALTLRGYNPGMTVSAHATRAGGANRSLLCAVTRKFPFKFRRFKVVQQVFSSPNKIDTLYDKSTRFGHAFAPAGRTGFTGIPARQIVAQWDNGAKNYCDYDTTTWDPNIGDKASDFIDLGVETDTIDCWEVAVAPPSIVTPNAHFYAMETNADNVIAHGAGSVTSTTDMLADGSWLTVSALNAATTAPGGGTGFLSPEMYLIEVPGTTECVLLYTDSHGVGLNSGAGAHLVDGIEYGGPMGTDKLAMSWLDRGLAERGVGYCRIGQGSDGDRYWGPNPNNWRFRKQAGIRSKPTRVVDESNTNDQGVTGTQSNVDAGKTFVYGAALRHIGAGRVYICTKAGDINGQMPEATSADVLGTPITSGTAEFICTGTFTSALFNATAVLGVQMMMSAQIKAQWPDVPFIRCGLLPLPDSTDSFATLANQTVSSTFGAGPTAKRGQYLQLLKSALGKSLLKYDHLWLPELYVENDPANYDGKILPDPAVANKIMFAAHLTSYGHHLARPAVTPASLV